MDGSNEQRIPVSLITGFLGSGKTSLLSHLIHHAGMAETAVIINEFGEIGLDHQLVEAVDGEAVLLASGCICCTIRDDLAQTLCSLEERRVAGSIPNFRRVVIETTGLADPAPIIHSMMQDAAVRRMFRLDGVITTVDAVNGQMQLDKQSESVKQAAVADRLVITKTDLVSEAQTEALIQRLQRLNPEAAVVIGKQGVIAPEQILDVGLFPQRGKQHIEQAAHAHAGHHEHGECGPDCGHDDHAGHRHDANIRSHSFRFDTPLAWPVVSDWLGGLAYFHGGALLRMKGLLNLEDESVPVAVHGVQHLFHEPTQLQEWPDDDRSSRLVFITRGLDRETIAAAYAAAIASHLEP